MSAAQPQLTFQQLLDACKPGGASVLTSVCSLAPAAGWHATVAPPRYLKGKEPTYSMSLRGIDGSTVMTILLDSKGSQANRREAAMASAIRNDEHPAHVVAKRIPRVVLRLVDESTGEEVKYMDLELPHRWVDGHIRSGYRNGEPVTSDQQYRAMRDATPANLSAVMEASPMSLVDGLWDASRKSNQLRLRSAIVGEIFGVLADQDPEGPSLPLRGGARVDPIAASVQLDAPSLRAIADRQKNELSPKAYGNFSKAAKEKNSGSVLGLGAIPPTLSALGGVSCTQITRSTVLSFATLRQLRFGGSGERDVAFRALLAAVAVLSMALADEELYLRADCDLIEAGPRDVKLDGRYGVQTPLAPIDAEQAIALTEEALAHAEEHGLQWDGTEFIVDADPTILKVAVDDDDDDARGQ